MHLGVRSTLALALTLTFHRHRHASPLTAHHSPVTPTFTRCVYQEQKIAKGIAEVEYVTQKEAIAKRASTVKAPPVRLG